MRRFSWSITGVLLTATIVLLNWPLFLGTAAPIWDADHAFSTWQMLVGDHARNGQFLLWNPWSNAGSPDGFEPSTGAFSPLNVVLGFLTGGVYWGYVVYWIFLWCLAGLGMLMLSRHLEAPAWIAFIVSLGFALSGCFTGHAQHTTVVHAMAWFPWVIWRVELALKERRAWHFVEAGAFYGLSGLGGYPALTIGTGVFLALWALGRSLLARPRSIAFGALGVLLVAFVGFVVMSPTYLGYLVEAKGYTDRAGELSKEVVLGHNALHPGALATLSSPYCPRLWISNNSPDLRSPKLWNYTDVSSLSVYVGPLVLWLAFLSLGSRQNGYWKVWLSALGGLFFALALAKVLPIREWAYDLFVPFRYFRHASLFRFYSVFCLCILAAYGATSLTRLLRRDSGAGSLRRLRGMTVAAALFSIVSFQVVMCLAEDHGPFPLAAYVHCFGAWMAVIAVAFAPSWVKREWLVAGLLTVAVLDGTFNHMASREFMYDRSSAVLESWQLISREHSTELEKIPLERILQPMGPGFSNKNLPAKRPALHSYTALMNTLFESLVKQPQAASLALTRKRVWFSSEPLWISPTETALDAFLSTLEEGAAPGLLLHQRSEMLLPLSHRSAVSEVLLNEVSELPPAIAVEVDIVSYRPNLLELEVSCPEDGYLLVTDRWAPGWKCSVSGSSVEVQGGWFVYRAIPVKGGNNTISFSYRPFGFPWLLVVSWCTLLFIAGVSARRAWVSRFAARLQAEGGEG